MSVHYIVAAAPLCIASISDSVVWGFPSPHGEGREVESLSGTSPTAFHSHQWICQRLRRTKGLRMLYLIIRSLDMLNSKRSCFSECLGVRSVLDTRGSISPVHINISLYLYRSQVGR